MKTAFAIPLAIVGILLVIYSINASQPLEPAEAPVSVELPSDEIEIHCEIIKPA